MSCIIRFSAEKEDYIKVEEDLDVVVDLWRTGDGSPLGVSRANGTRAYVNPDRIAFVGEAIQSAARQTLSGAGSGQQSKDSMRSCRTSPVWASGAVRLSPGNYT
jgi:hypothetical protein